MPGDGGDLPQSFVNELGNDSTTLPSSLLCEDEGGIRVLCYNPKLSRSEKLRPLATLGFNLGGGWPPALAIS